MRSRASFTSIGTGMYPRSTAGQRTLHLFPVRTELPQLRPNRQPQSPKRCLRASVSTEPLNALFSPEAEAPLSAIAVANQPEAVQPQHYDAQVAALPFFCKRRSPSAAADDEESRDRAEKPKNAARCPRARDTSRQLAKSASFSVSTIQIEKAQSRFSTSASPYLERRV